MRMLVIGPPERELITAAIIHAKQAIVRWDDVKHLAHADQRPDLRLKDRKPGKRPSPPPKVMLPGGFACALSYEEQPAGLMRHLSVSVPIAGKLPNPHAFAMIAEEFGFRQTAEWLRSGQREYHGGLMRMWLEEFKPGHEAINVVELVEQ